MENNKQTAVEWLVEQMIYQMDIRIENTIIGCELFEQAKEMEKQQIIKAHKEGNKHNGWALRHEHEQYYNEEYGKDTTDNTNL